VLYLGAALSVACHEWRGEVALKLGAVRKELLLRAGCLPLLPWEPPSAVRVQESQQQPDQREGCITACRRAVIKYLEATGARTLKETQHALLKKRAYFLSIEHDFTVDLAYVQWLCEKGGDETLEKEILDAFPTAVGEKSLVETKTELQRLSATDYFAALPAGTRGVYNTVYEGLLELERGVAPRLCEATTAPFLAKVAARMAHFFHFPGDGTGELRGATGVLQRWTAISGMPKPVTLADLDGFAGYRWVLPEGQRKLLDQVVTEAWKAHAPPPGTDGPLPLVAVAAAAAASSGDQQHKVKKEKKTSKDKKEKKAPKDLDVTAALYA
jgi:hypothetical protein